VEKKYGGKNRMRKKVGENQEKARRYIKLRKQLGNRRKAK
jgi:hypothetical protein